MMRQNRKSGFTLVEMMVAIAVFSIVMVTAMSALLNVIDANNKARAIKTAINNINFALEGISKDMRVGTDYGCGSSPEEPSGDCPLGGDIIRYRSNRAYFDTVDGEYRFAYYKFEGTQIWEYLEKDAGDSYSRGVFSPITSEEVKIENVVFYVLGVDDSDLPSGSGKTQPRMIMTINGKAGSKTRIETSFDLQTSVNQMTRVITTRT